MPNSRKPIGDRLLARSTDVTVALFGGALAVSALFRRVGYIPSPVNTIPDWIVYVASAGILVGAVLVPYGALRLARSRSRDWMLERTGWLAVGPAWTVYVIGMVMEPDILLLSTLFPTMMAMIAFGRVAAGYREEWSTRRRVEGFGL